MKTAIYEIEYYQTDKRFGWTNTLRDKVLATSEENAIEKFKTKHPNIKTFTIVNYTFADY